MNGRQKCIPFDIRAREEGSKNSPRGLFPWRQDTRGAKVYNEGLERVVGEFKVSSLRAEVVVKGTRTCPLPVSGRDFHSAARRRLLHIFVYGFHPFPPLVNDTYL